MSRLPTALEVAAARERKKNAATSLFVPSSSQLTAPAPAPAVAVGGIMPPLPSAAPPQSVLPTGPSTATSSSTISSAARAAGSSAAAAPAPFNPTAILVSRRQQGNPVLRAIRNVPWQYGETTADYVLSETTCALFLSIRYHLLHPNYVTRRLLELTLGYTLRIVLVLVDCDDPDEPVLAITQKALRQDATTVLAFSVVEAARYLETFRAFAKKPADLIKERHDGSLLAQLADALHPVRSLNKNDVATLHTRFGSLASILSATEEELTACPGLGDRKVRRLLDVFTEPFVPIRARNAAAAKAAAAGKVEASAASGAAGGGACVGSGEVRGGAGGCGSAGTSGGGAAASCRVVETSNAEGSCGAVVGGSVAAESAVVPLPANGRD